MMKYITATCENSEWIRNLFTVLSKGRRMDPMIPLIIPVKLTKKEL